MTVEEIAEKVDRLSFRSVIDEMVASGKSYSEVAAFIQDVLGKLKTIERDRLEEALAFRDARKDLSNQVGEVISKSSDSSGGESPRNVVSISPRVPGEIAKGIYSKTGDPIDSLVEIEAVYLSLRDRLGWLMQYEQDTGQPYSKMGLEVRGIVELLRLYEEIRENAIGTGGSNVNVNLSFGNDSNSNAVVSKVMQNPESRQKIVTLLEKLRGTGLLGSGLVSGRDVIDAEVIESDEDQVGNDG